MSDERNDDLENAETDPRRSPLTRHVPLWVGFLIIVVVGIVTVLVPEMSDDGDEDGAPTSATAAEDGDEPPEPTAAPAAVAPAP